MIPTASQTFTRAWSSASRLARFKARAKSLQWQQKSLPYNFVRPISFDTTLQCNKKVEEEIPANVTIPPPLEDFIEPRWWTGVPATPTEDFLIDCKDIDMQSTDALDPNGMLAQRMNELFERTGLCLLKNTQTEDVQIMRLLATHIVKNQIVYSGGANPRNAIEPNVYDVGTPLIAHLQYHHEMAYVHRSPRHLAFLAQQPGPPGKGATFVSDNVRATEMLLSTEFGQKLRKLGLCYVRKLTDREQFEGTQQMGVYNHWQQSMMTDDPEEAAEVARSKGLVVNWGADRLMETRYYCSAFEYFPGMDKNLLFASIADDAMWFDTWPLVQHLPYADRPLALLFGDGTEMTRSEKQTFVDVYDAFGLPLPWEKGDVGVVCNYRWAHGRPAIHLEEGEQRSLGVVLGETFEKVGPVEGKW